MPDYMFLLESRLSPEQRAVMLRVQELRGCMGFNLYLTGGTVRDLITGASLRDLDFTVEGQSLEDRARTGKGRRQNPREDEKFRHIEVLFAGDVEGSISAARDDHLRAARDAPGDPLVHDHGGFASAGFFAERHRDFAESRVARIVAGSHERLV